MPPGWVEIDSSELDAPGPLNPPIDPYASEDDRRQVNAPAAVAGSPMPSRAVSAAPSRWENPGATNTATSATTSQIPATTGNQRPGPDGG